MNPGIIELDLHGMNCEKAKAVIDESLNKADSSVYTLRLIHGYHGGIGIKSMIQDEYGYGRSEKVKRIRPGCNPGISELVLREL